MHSYKAILCDLFNTLILFDLPKLPTVAVKGRRIPSTTPALLPLLMPYRADLTVDLLQGAISTSWRRARERKDHQETSSAQRFATIVHALGIELSPPELSLLAQTLALKHTRMVAGCAMLPEGNRQALLDLAERFDLALVSNFDYGQAVRERLVELQIIHLFKSVVISEEVGVRKPAALPFSTAMNALGVRGSDCLFVGDSASEDVLGAQALNMHVAWINLKARPITPGIPEPQFTLRRFEQLPPLLIP